MGGRHVVERVACDRAYGDAVDEDVLDLVLGGRRDREGLARTVVDGGGRCDRTVQSCRGGEGELVDCERYADRMGRDDVIEDVACRRRLSGSYDGGAVHDDVGDMVSGGGRHVECLAAVVVHGHAADRVHRPVRARRCGDYVRVDRESGGDGDCPVDVRTGGGCDPVAP